MKQVFTDAADLLNTTETAKDLERTAFNLGMGDGAAIEASGLMT